MFFFLSEKAGINGIPRENSNKITKIIGDTIITCLTVQVPLIYVKPAQKPEIR